MNQEIKKKAMKKTALDVATFVCAILIVIAACAGIITFTYFVPTKVFFIGIAILVCLYALFCIIMKIYELYQKNLKELQIKDIFLSDSLIINQDKNILVSGMTNSGKSKSFSDALKPCPCGHKEQPLLLAKKDGDTYVAICPNCKRYSGPGNITTTIMDWNNDTVQIAEERDI